MTSRLAKAGRVARNVVLVTAASVALAVCSTSTFRGADALFSSNSRIRPMTYAISSGKLPPDCLRTNAKMVKALEGILGRGKAETFAERMEKHIETYRERRAKAGGPAEVRQAETFLAGRAHCELTNMAIQNATPAEQWDFRITMLTMFALSDASENGARGAVFGPTAMRCANAIIEVCAQD